MCGKELGARTEFRTGACFECMTAMAEKLEESSSSSARLQEELDDKNGQIEKLSSKVSALEMMDRAEELGRNVAREGLGEDECPWAEGDAARLAWMKGYWAEQVSRSLRMARGVMTWSVDNLRHVHELAKGYGNDEIADKIDLIASKIDSYVG